MKRIPGHTRTCPGHVPDGQDRCLYICPSCPGMSAPIVLTDRPTIVTKFLTVDQPTSAPPRRQGKYAPRKLDPDTDGLSLVEFFGVIGGCLIALAIVASIALRVGPL